MKFTAIALLGAMFLFGCESESEMEKQKRRDSEAKLAEEYKREKNERVDRVNKFVDSLSKDASTKYDKEHTPRLIRNWIQKTLDECSIRKEQSTIVHPSEERLYEIRNFEIRTLSTNEGLTEADKLNEFTGKHYVLFQGSPVRHINPYDWRLKQDSGDHGDRREMFLIEDLRGEKWSPWEDRLWRCLIYFEEKGGELHESYIIGENLESIKKFKFPD